LHNSKLIKLIYQLPSGKIIYLSVEQYLSLSDEDIDELSTYNVGEYVKSPFHGSVIKNTKKKEKEKEDIDDGIDFHTESEEFYQEKPSFNEEIPLEEIPDTPEDNSELD